MADTHIIEQEYFDEIFKELESEKLTSKQKLIRLISLSNEAMEEVDNFDVDSSIPESRDAFNKIYERHNDILNRIINLVSTDFLK